MKPANLIAIATVALGLLTSQAMFAQSPVTVLYPYVSKVNVNGSDSLAINVPGNLSLQHLCPQPWYARSPYPLNDPRTQAWMAIALESFRLKKQVHVITTGCDANGYPKLTGLQLYQP